MTTNRHVICWVMVDLLDEWLHKWWVHPLLICRLRDWSYRVSK